jgi:hypothetical protein
MVITIGVIAYAWVSLATINNIDGIGLTASAGDDLQISVDGENFYNSLPANIIEELFEEINLYDVTTIDNVNFIRGGLNRGSEAIANLHYLSFDLWMQTTRQEKSVYLFNNVTSEVDYYNPSNGTFVVSRGVFWMANETFNNGPDTNDVVTKGSINQYHSADAIRIGIREIIDEQNPLDTRGTNDLQNVIFDPSENPIRGYGLPYGAFSYFFRRANYLLSVPSIIPETLYRLTEMDPYNPYQALDNDSLIATMQQTNLVNEDNRIIYRTKVRINIWIEGWDVDALDAIENDPVKIQLQFKLANRFIN